MAQLKAKQEIAILGYACRLPAAPDVRSFWDVLTDGRCVITEVGADRWNKAQFLHPDVAASGKSYTWAAGQIANVWDFDPGFFGISPREAIQIDPQQRLLLQLTWEALENAGLPPSALAGSRTGVYVGASSLDYANNFLTDLAETDVQFMTGNTLSIVSNRVSYIYDLRGPSFTVDTACSSSLVALNEAMEAIRAGLIDTAIVAGVNLLLSPYPFVGFSRATMLSKAGLCRAFDADGDGYVRSEGGVVLVIRAVDAARSAGNDVRGVLVGSGVNSDGRTVGMSLPSAHSQAALLREVYDRFEVDPDRLAFVEAHGTGTRVGDPAEAEALGSVLGRRRSRPLPIGSVKTNVGHLEPASGLVGLLKAQLALEQNLLPPSLHFTTPNPDIPFQDLNLEVAATARALEQGPRPRFAGVNSFGFGGTNAHVLLRDPDPTPPAITRRPDAAAPLVLSASGREALADLARRYLDRLEDASEAEAALVTNAAAYRRQRLDQRAVILGTTLEEKRAGLAALAEGRKATNLVEATAVAPAAPVVFAFSGNGSQWAGMGRAVYQSDRAFRLSFDRVDRAFVRVAGWSLQSALMSETLVSDLARTEIAQPLLFAIQVALTEALIGRGLKPDAVIGHSVGEVAAAWACGALTLGDAVKVIHARSTHQEVTRHLGAMAAVLLSADKTRAALGSDPRFAEIAIAAVNSPRSVTISGPVEAIDAFAKHGRKHRIVVKRLDLDYPFHCALVDTIRDPLMGSLAGIAPRAERLPFISTVSGTKAGGESLDARYWWHNVRDPVQFEAAVRNLAAEGYRLFVEIGPRPVLTTYITDVLRAAEVRGTALPSLDKHDGDRADAIGAVLAAAFASGAQVEDTTLFGPGVARGVDLPHYPWQNRTYRAELTPEGLSSVRGTHHALLGARMRLDIPVWTNHLDAELVHWLGDHRVEDAVVMPGAGLAEMALSAARRWQGDGAIELSDFDIVAPLVLDGGTRETRVTLDADDRSVSVESRPRLSTDPWTLHARGRLSRAKVPHAVAAGAEGPVLRRVTADRLYALTLGFGLRYGPVFRRAHAVEILGPTAFSVNLAPADPATASAGFILDPTLLDACFHGLFALLDDTHLVKPGTAVLPIRFGRLRVAADARTPVKARVAVTRASSQSLVAAFDLLDSAGHVVATLEDARFQAVQLTQIEDPDDLAYRVLPRRLAAPGAISALGSADSDALATLIDRRDLARPAHPDLGEAALLLEAAVLSAAFRGVAGLFAGVGPVSLDAMMAAGLLAADALPLAARLLEALDERGYVSQSEAGWERTDATPPDLDVVLRTLVAEHPDRIAEATLAARLPEVLAERFRGGLAPAAVGIFPAALLDQMRTSSPAARPLAEAILGLAAEAIATWPRSAPLRLLLVGAGDPGLARRLAALIDPRFVTLTVTDADASLVERARLRAGERVGLRYHALADLGGQGGFDLALSAGALTSLPAGSLDSVVAALVPGGGLIAVEPAPSLVLDAIEGVAAGWWHRTLDPHTPAGAPATATEWARALVSAGLVESSTRALASDETEAFVLAARRRSDIVAQPEPRAVTLPLVLSPAEGAPRLLADALATALGVIGGPVLIGAATRTADGVREIGLDGDATMQEMKAFDALLSSDDVQDLVFVATGLVAEGVPLDTLTTTLERLRRLGLRLGDRRVRLWVVSPGAMQSLSGDGESRADSASVWGFLRVAANEMPGLDIRQLDAAPELGLAVAAERLAAEIRAPGAEHELLLDAGGRAGLRIVRGGVLTPHAPAGTEPGATLAIGRPGVLDALGWQPVARRAPVDDEIEIVVEASGLNFRDVMWALGLLPHEALEDGFAGPTLGMECAGTVVRTGPSAHRYRIGQRVMMFAPACFASHVTVSEQAAAPVPDHLPPEAAATVPVAFLTAYYALVQLAAIVEGETVLIHGGAGGVGLAALQIAKWRGATVIASAGSPDKRALLTALGADHVVDSRSLAFADDVRALTRGAGIDVVLNSLAGEAMEASLEVLKPFGRFLELGKRDFYANSRIALRPFRQNLSYFGIDADQLLSHRRPLAERLFTELARLFAEGVFSALPYRLFPADAVAEAFRLMQSSGHVGKIVIAPPAIPAAVPARAGAFLKDDASYLVAGGTGGFGFEAAKRLAARGARHIVVASRRGTVSDEVAADIRRLGAQGVTIRVEKVDLTDTASVAALLDRIEATGPALRGLLHTAMVLDDALLANLDADRIAQVLAPKIAGAEALDAATRERTLDFFVLYSSATTLVGNPGQANYVAANAYLEALARRRRAAGLPALTVAWGAISGAGYLARNAQVNDLLSRKLGRSALDASDALDGLMALLERGDRPVAEAAVGFGRIDWRAARKDLVLLATPLAEELPDADADEDAGESGIDLKERLAGLSRTDSVEIITQLLAGEISRILRLPAEEIDRHKPLAAIGMDSLLALELRIAAEQRLGVEIPLMSLANGATLTDIANRVLARVTGEQAETGLSVEAELLAKAHVAGDEGAEAATIEAVEIVEERSRRIRNILE
ncbi:SDR family NAD(P)-dependent oxidoreductase [Segnochrobactraceae bacterium EtOH-i3]